MQTFTVLDRNQYIDQLQSIHALRDALELSQDEYRKLLQRLTGSNSARYMTPEQREHVITFLKVHKAIDEAIASAEEARAILNETYSQTPSNTLTKSILLDGKYEASMTASIEDILATMRNLHGPDLKLSGIQEKQQGYQTVLELSFERPAVYLLAS